MLSLKEYQTVTNIAGPLMMVEMVDDARYATSSRFSLPTAQFATGRFCSRKRQALCRFSRAQAVSTSGTRRCASWQALELGVSRDLLAGCSADSASRRRRPENYSDKRSTLMKPINRSPATIQMSHTDGISAIDGLNPLIRGQKLPIFSGAACLTTINGPVARQATVLVKASSSRSSLRRWASPSRRHNSLSTICRGQAL